MDTCQLCWTCPKFDTTEECKDCPFRRIKVYIDKDIAEEHDRRYEARMKYQVL